MRKYKKNSVPNNVILDSNILPQTDANLSSFNLSESHSTCIPFDKLIPVYWNEMSPNDHFEIDVKALGRLMPMVAPTMSNIKLKFFSFFVPNRLLWQNWTKFMGERLYQNDTNVYTVPQISLDSDGVAVGSLSDFLGIPPMKIKHTVSALPFRAYNLIWNQWFRSNQLQEPCKEFSGDTVAEETMEKYPLRSIGKPLDYFTSCLPTPLAGGQEVKIPVAGKADVLTTNKLTMINTLNVGDSKIYLKNLQAENNNSNDYMRNGNIRNTVLASDGADTNLYADLSAVTGISINQLRYASALQVLLERDNLAGELYVDLMKMHFGTTVPDFLVGRSQFLGSTTSYVQQEPIAQTSGSNIQGSTSPLGNLAAVGVAMENSKLCEYSAVEHGILMVMVCVEGDVLYQQGLDRKFSRKDRFDYPFPEFANLGEQPILNQEIFLSNNEIENAGIFGYNERYRELRQGINKVSGRLRSGVKLSLDVWHLGQKFENLPKLNSEFIEQKTPIKRVLASADDDQLILSCFFDIKATRALPMTARPSFITGKL